MGKIIAVIPAYNESSRIGPVLNKVKKFVSEVIVVDDGSKDDTSSVARAEGALVLRHCVNMGKGNAVKTGCDYAIKNGANCIVIIDADGQHRPSDIPRFLKELERVDIVFGSRTFDKTMPLILRAGNCFINLVMQLLYGIKLKDTQSGFRAFRTVIYPKIRWRAADYTMESEMIANAGKAKLRYAEIMIPTIYGDKYKGTTPLDGIKIVWNMLWWRFCA